MTTSPLGFETPAVPEVSDHLIWWQRFEMFALLRVVGPWRRRRKRPPMPPPLTAEETARRLFRLPISYWTYDFEPGVRHLGPMAQDFAAAFGLGNTNRKIHIVDANGVAVVALQVLNRKVAALQREVDRLTAQLDVSHRSPDVSAGQQIQPLGTASLEPNEVTRPHHPEETTMSENQNPEIETTDQVEGHVSSNRIEADDVEGHVIRGKLVEDESDDVEGHVSSNRFRPDEDEMFGEDDVQGHGATSGRVTDPEPEDV
jgi:hypothetical protein